MVKNITLAVEESILNEVKFVAAERRTSVHALVPDVEPGSNP